MMTRPRILAFPAIVAALFVSAATFAGCLDLMTSEVPFGDEFDLAIDQQSRVGEVVNVAFVDVIGDSRCPVDAVCVWEGDAEISLEVQVTGERKKLVTLHTHRSQPTERIVDGYRIRLVDLRPLPTTAGLPDRSDYVATLVVEKI